MVENFSGQTIITPYSESIPHMKRGLHIKLSQYQQITQAGNKLRQI